MKKTLAALIVSAFAASAANAAVVYDNEGTKVELNGSLRLIMEKADKKEYDRAGKSTKKTNSALRNAGSRFGIHCKIITQITISMRQVVQNSVSMIQILVTNSVAFMLNVLMQVQVAKQLVISHSVVN